MNILKILTAGESHGKALLGVIDGVPAGFSLSAADIDADLIRRQGGYGRGGRMIIESDQAEILSGVRWGKTIGSPVAVLIENNDWTNWQHGMSAREEDRGSISPVRRPRPGHADLAGAIKYNTKDMRDVLERSSARETAARVALGAIAKKILAEFGISMGSYVRQIGNVAYRPERAATAQILSRRFRAAERSPVRCPDRDISAMMVRRIDKAKGEKNSLGGIFCVFAMGVPIGLGSHVHWDRKLDGRLAQSVMSIQAIKGVEIGSGFDAAARDGSDVMDEIFYRKPVPEGSLSFSRKSNHAGGIEGGISNGMPIVITAAMKPIPTLRKPLRSVDVVTKKSEAAAYERSDVCAVPAAAIVGEAMVALTILDAFLEKFGGDSSEEILANYSSYCTRIGRY